jgi:hypothetical protein
MIFYRAIFQFLSKIQLQLDAFFGAAARIFARRTDLETAPTPDPATNLLSIFAGFPVIIPIGNTRPISLYTTIILYLPWIVLSLIVCYF